MKRIMSLILAAAFFISVLAVPVSASDQMVWAKKNSWSRTIVVEHTGWWAWQKQATALVSINDYNNGKDGIDIQMLNSKKKVIWAENYTMKSSKNKSNFWVKRTYTFGKDNKKYWLRFRTNSKSPHSHHEVHVTAKKYCKVYAGSY